MQPAPNRSLFIVSLPRSLSTVIYEAARFALRLQAPIWTEAGEILNGERMPFWSSNAMCESQKFSTGELSHRWRQLEAFLDCVVASAGFAYKDVVQPFVSAKWLKGRGLALLRIQRPIAHVAWSMLRRRWTYPSHAAEANRTTEEGVILGLRRADRALETLQAVTLHYDELVEDEHVLHEGLRRLYPETEIGFARYINREFVARRDMLRESLRSDEALAFIERAERLLQSTPDEGDR